MTERKTICVIASACASLASNVGHAQPTTVAAPVLEVGDNWVFDRTIQRGPGQVAHRRVDLRIGRIDENVMLVRAKSSAASGPYEDYRVGLDWSQTRVVDGQPAVTGRPFKFPMAAQKDRQTIRIRRPITA
jgi:hypothetical protein